MDHSAQQLMIEPASNAKHDEHEEHKRILRYVQRACHPATVSMVKHQGACSTTFIVSTTSTDISNAGIDQVNISRSVLQIRPVRFQISAEIARAARDVHGELAPGLLLHRSIVIHGTQYQLLRMSLLSGSRFDELQPACRIIDQKSIERMEVLMSGMAHFFAQSWQEADSCHHKCDGKIGRSIPTRLRRLAEELPSAALRRLAGRCLDDMQAGLLDILPVVLTHGDLLSSNIMVDEQRWKLRGVIDWAEAEYLPFGMALYGVERLLGYMSTDKEKLPCFVYYDCADELRELFWKQLIEWLPDFHGQLRTSIELSKTVGVLLWHGFAWDDGKIDRVISDSIEDAVDLAYLETLTGEKKSQHHFVSML
ncbi:hypothetical protein MRB53_041240 [Persea americana]|nr:hypothetical protein MRB53_041240 [Persea americana]